MFWIITSIVCIILVGIYFFTHDEARFNKQKLRNVRQRLAELEEEKNRREASSEE